MVRFKLNEIEEQELGKLFRNHINVYHTPPHPMCSNSCLNINEFAKLLFLETLKDSITDCE